MSSSRARASASSPHGYQSTGLSACWSRYGEVSWARRFAIAVGSPLHVPSSRNRHRGRRAAGRGALLARRQVQRPASSCSGQMPLDPDTGKLVEGSIGDQTRRCLDNLAVVAAAAGAQLADAVRCGIYVTDISHVQGRQRGLRRATSTSDPPARTTIGVAALPLGARRRDRRDPRRARLMHGHRRRRRRARGRRSSASRGARRCCPRARSPSARAASSRSRPRTCSAPARSRSAASRPSSPRWATRLRAAASSPRRPATTRQALAAAAARARRAAARSSCPPTRRSPRSRPRAAQGATVHIGGDSVDECLEAAQRARATRAGSPSCTRSTTRTIVAGQGSLGLELLEDVPDLAKVVVPVGGGGLCAGHRDRGQVRAAGGRGRRRAGRRVRAVPGVAAARRAGAGRPRR